jgi:hypothetical protein
VIGYYVHHHGRGHLNRANAILAHVRMPSTILSSLPGPWLTLPRDDDGVIADPAPGGRLHWAPRHHDGLRDRMAAIAAWIAAARPTLIVVDVSVEVAVLARTMGVPAVVMAMRGDRLDAAHTLGYDLADALLAPWPAALPEPGWPARWREKTRHVGAFSRYDGRDRPATRARRVAVLLGAGGTDDTLDLDAAVAATPDWTWDVLGARGRWDQDPWPALCAAEVVVTHAGQNAVAEVAAARRPAVVVPQDRPFGEQTATATALDRGGLAVVRRTWPRPREWTECLAEASGHDGATWTRWAPGDGARRAAAVLEELACARR